VDWLDNPTALQDRINTTSAKALKHNEHRQTEKQQQQKITTQYTVNTIAYVSRNISDGANILLVCPHLTFS